MKTYVSPKSSCRSLSRLQDLRLHGNVERRDGLVAHDQLRVDRERARDADALALAAGELVREAVVVLGVETDDLEQLLHPRLDLLVGAEPVDLERLADDEADALARVQRRVRILEDHRHLAPDRAACSVRESFVMSRPSNQIRPSVVSSSRMMQRASVDFPHPDSPTIPSVSPGLMLKRDAVDRLHGGDLLLEDDAAGDREVLLDVLDDEQLVAGRLKPGFRLDGGGLRHYAVSAIVAFSFAASRSFVSSSRWQAWRCFGSRWVGRSSGFFVLQISIT